MEETGIGREPSLIAHHQTAEVPRPGEGAFDAPPPPLAPILMGGGFVVAPCWDHRVKAPTGHPRAQGMTVIAPIGQQALGPFAGASGLAGPADGDRLEGRFEQGDCCRGRRVQGLLPEEPDLD